MEVAAKTISDEEYIILKSQMNMKSNPLTAKAWIITAKALFPNNFEIQYEAYLLEKENKNIKEAAKGFSEMLMMFPTQAELWKEVEKLTVSLRNEVESLEPEMQFLNDMFRHIPLEVQHRLLLLTADHCDDTMEHCRLLLLLLKKFPQSIPTHGPRLVDTLLSAEKHSHAGNQPLNPYRQLLVCELLPLLGDVKIELSVKLLYRLLHKSIEYYLFLMNTALEAPRTSNTDESDSFANDLWLKLFQIIELAGKHLGWDPTLCSVGSMWNKDAFSQKVLSFCHQQKTASTNDELFTKQLLYCLTLLFLNCLYEYKYSLKTVNSNGQSYTNYILVEAFVDPSLPIPFSEPMSKRRKLDVETNTPYVSIDKPGSNHIISNFIMACNCWDLLRSSDSLHKEYIKLNSYLKLDLLLYDFMIDYSLYKGIYEESLVHQTNPDPSLCLDRTIRLMYIYYCKKNYTTCFEHLLLVIGGLPTNNMGQISNQMTVGGTMRHLHYLPFTQLAILQYCSRLLVNIIKDNLSKHPQTYIENALGTLIIMIQLDWPQQHELLIPIFDQIKQRRSFHFPLFQTYVINMDILEDMMYLKTGHGGRVTLHIFNKSSNSTGQRRIGTRRSDKGDKVDFKLAVKRQIARCNEPIDELIIKFITQQRIMILQMLLL